MEEFKKIGGKYMNCMKYCPIYRTSKILKGIKSNIKYWWKYEVKKEPKPDITEVFYNLLPTLISGMAAMVITKQIIKKLEESNEKKEFCE